MTREVKYEGGQPPSNLLYRCKTCGRLLRMKLIEEGVCAGHQVIFASGGTFTEWLRVKWWDFGDWYTNRLNEVR